MPEIPVRLTLMLESDDEADVADMPDEEPIHYDPSFNRPTSREPGTGALLQARLRVADTRDRTSRKHSNVSAINPDPSGRPGERIRPQLKDEAWTSHGKARHADKIFREGHEKNAVRSTPYA